MEDVNKPVRSFSQTTTLMKCPKQYEYIYIKRAPRRSSAAMFVGSTCHKSQEIFMKSRLAGKDISEEDLLKATEEFWDAGVKQINIKETENIGLLKLQAMNLSKLRYPDLLEINPKFVEEDIVVFPDKYSFGIRGIVDLVDANNELRDLKTSAQSPPSKYGLRPMQGHDLQLALYAYLLRELHDIDPPKVWIDYMVKTKVPKVVSVEVNIDDKIIDHILKCMEENEEVIHLGLFPRNRMALGCSKKACAFWDDCVGY